MDAREAPDKRQCGLLLFVATSSEEDALREAAKARGIPFERIRDRAGLGDYYWLGKVGDERVIAVRAKGMGPLSRGGSADLALRFCAATGASAVVQVGMAFGIAPKAQKFGDVLVSSSLIPYDNRDVRSISSRWHRLLAVALEKLRLLVDALSRRGAELTISYPGRYVIEYTRATRQRASPVLVSLFQREQDRGAHNFQVHVGALLSGGARIHTRIFRDELARTVPAGEDPIVGGEMEGVGLLGTADEPNWCVVKGIVDFADEDRDAVYKQNRPTACRNAAEFVLSALVNDARRDILH
jgi:nucleoside phosphorylase